MEKHILIVLFDEQKFIASEPNTVEVIKTTLENATIHKDLEIYFFKILSTSTNQQNDTLSRVQSLNGQKNFFIEYEEKFFFRNVKSLKRGFDLVKNNRNNNDLKWYFVSIGHGSGHSIFDLNRLYRTFLNNNLINNKETDHINEELPDKNLYIS